jgi:hypothetical protein
MAPATDDPTSFSVRGNPDAGVHIDEDDYSLILLLHVYLTLTNIRRTSCCNSITRTYLCFLFYSLLLSVHLSDPRG